MRFLTTVYLACADAVKNRSEFQKALARGTIWLGMGGGSVHGLRLVRNMILARLLAPEVFGIMALVMAFNVFFEAFTEVGIRESVIQNPNSEKTTFINGAFWLSAARCTILYTLAFVAAPFIASLYKSPEIIPLMRIVFLSLIFNGLMSPRTYVALKRMNYRKWVLVYHGSTLVGLSTAIGYGILHPTIWALVIGIVTEAFARFVLSYCITPYLPRFEFDRDSTQALIRFARGIFGLPVLVFLYNRADIFVIGFLCTVHDLGLYNLALSLVQLPFMIFSTVISPLLLPSFSRIQHDNSQLFTGVVNALKYVSIIFAPMLVLMALLSRQILSTIYGDTYVQVSLVFSLFCIVIMIRILGTVIVSSFFSRGMPQHSRMASIIRTVVMLGIIVPSIMKGGLIGAACANLFVSTIWITFSVWKFFQILDKKMSLKAYAIVSSGIISCLIIGAVTVSI